jgi:FtsP/CotA-like multicopper oxidase with cupredoxin domain
VIAGSVKMRSRFADYTGKYVLHCHILGHEDRGMMQLVEVIDNKTTVKHH